MMRGLLVATIIAATASAADAQISGITVTKVGPPDFSNADVDRRSTAALVASSATGFQARMSGVVCYDVNGAGTSTDSPTFDYQVAFTVSLPAYQLTITTDYQGCMRVVNDQVGPGGTGTANAGNVVGTVELGPALTTGSMNLADPGSQSGSQGEICFNTTDSAATIVNASASPVTHQFRFQFTNAVVSDDWEAAVKFGSLCNLLGQTAGTGNGGTAAEGHFVNVSVVPLATTTPPPTALPTPTVTESPTPSATESPTPTESATPTITLTATLTTTESPTPTLSPTPTVNPTATPASLDHFLCYEVHRRSINEKNIGADDDFGQSTVVVRQAKRLCAPAQKIHGSDQGDPTAPSHPGHLTFYTIRQIDPRFQRVKNLEVEDQFGRITVDLVRPERLLVPTAKSLVATPPLLATPLDHFKCYRVRGAHQRVDGLRVVTQFEQAAGTELALAVKRPRNLCVPVDKTHGNVHSGIANPRVGLMCYQVRAIPQQNLPHVFTKDQFREGDYDLFGVRDLCVPLVDGPGICGDGSLNSPGEDCERGPGNDAACPGLCDTEACTCPAPQLTPTPTPTLTATPIPTPTATPACGNGTREGTEQCDGSPAGCMSQAAVCVDCACCEPTGCPDDYCGFADDGCGGTLTCGGVPLGADCTTLDDCCPGTDQCGDNMCGGDGTACCQDIGSSCGDDCDCCGGNRCDRGTCCVDLGGACSQESDCCFRTACTNGLCCEDVGGDCSGDFDCCIGLVCNAMTNSCETP